MNTRLVTCFFLFCFASLSYSFQQENINKITISLDKNTNRYLLCSEISLYRPVSVDSVRFFLVQGFELESVKIDNKEVDWKEYPSGKENIYSFYLIPDKEQPVISITYSGIIENDFIEISRDTKWFPSLAGMEVDNFQIFIEPAHFELLSADKSLYFDNIEKRFISQKKETLNNLSVVLFKDFESKKVRYNDNTVLTIYSRSVDKNITSEMRTAIEGMLGIFFENFGVIHSAKEINIFICPDFTESRVIPGVTGIFSSKFLDDSSDRVIEYKEFFKMLSLFYSEYWLKETPDVENMGFANYLTLKFIERNYGLTESNKVSQHYKDMLSGSDDDMSYKVPLVLKNISHLIGYEKFKGILKDITAEKGQISLAGVIRMINERYGRDFNWYIQQFTDRNDLPNIEINYRIIKDENLYKADFSVNQHTEYVFKVPVDIEINFKNDSEYRILVIDKKEMRFKLELSSEPVNIKIDPFGLFFGKLEVNKN